MHVVVLKSDAGFAGVELAVHFYTQNSYVPLPGSVPFLSNRAVTLGSTCFLRAYVDPGTPLGRENKKIFSKILVLCVRSKQKHPIQLFE